MGRPPLSRVRLAGMGATALIGLSIFSAAGSNVATAQIRGDSLKVLEVDPDNGRPDWDSLRARTPQGPPPRTSWDGKPDFNGVYYPYLAMNEPSADLRSLYKPEVKALQARLHAEVTTNLRCYPNIWPAAFTRPHPVQVFHGPGVFILINEVFGVARITPIVDGPPTHDPSIRPSFQGDSVGYWDGDTLVIDVTNFNGLGWLSGSLTVTSDQLRVVERWTRPDPELLEVQATAEDPKFLTAPYTFPRMRRGRLSHDFSSFDPCVDDTDERLSHYDSLKIDPATVKLSEEVLLNGARTVLDRETGLRATR
jgi:hypothetical protein